MAPKLAACAAAATDGLCWLKPATEPGMTRLSTAINIPMFLSGAWVLPALPHHSVALPERDKGTCILLNHLVTEMQNSPLPVLFC